MLKKYNQIWKRVKKLLKIEFDSEPVYGNNYKYIIYIYIYIYIYMYIHIYAGSTMLGKKQVELNWNGII